MTASVPSTRDALLAATRELLWERGYEATSPNQILERSGVGKGSLYHHFRNKKELARAALEQIEAMLTDTFDRLFDADLPVAERIERGLAGCRDVLKGCPLGRMAGDPAIADDELREPAARYFDHLQRRITGALQEAGDSGEIRLPADPAGIATALIASLQGGYVLSRLQNDPRHLRDAVRYTLTMFRQFVDNARFDRPRYRLPVVSVGV